MRMGIIYSSAETVSVWIGVPMVESDAPTLREILLKLDWARKNVRSRSLDSEWPVWSDDYYARVVSQFFLKEWWRRTWVFQEIVLAKSIRLHYGTVSVTWNILNGAHLYFYYLSSKCAVFPIVVPVGVYEAMKRISIIKDVRYRRARGLGVRLTQLLYRDRLSFCSDPRDRIYALLGLAEDQDSVSPDYTKPVQLVLQDTVEILVEKERSLNIICMLPKSRRMNGLPSWVPDFTTSSHSRDLMDFLLKEPDECHVFMASGTMTFSGVHVEAGILSAKGLILDIVDGMGSATNVPQFNLLEKPTLQFLSGHTCLQQSTTDKSRYPTRDDLLHAIWNTLVSSRQNWYAKATSASRTLYLTFKSVVIPKEKWPLKDIWNWDDLDEVRLFYAKNAMLKFAGRSFSDWVNIAMEVFESNLDFSVDDITEEIRDLPLQISSTLRDQRLLVTASGYIGFVPNETKRGDKICILYGMDVPVVLRKNQDGTYELIGPCYVHGVMEGELMNDMQNGVFEERVFDIA
ncbi:uncharacterized protein EAE97_011680 [Botrytis byssoidea]|uniref:Heterokaryon incompatibility domain-containing protein n=1 Tax=Botrytis byssoidea TaxID=139641 RepID=A0A9P5HPV6_9HELO|nr:uncharacterized protein EAE97_011680 [Botrytis byssoidea]KAF7919348.1 hypothetical protein EAE97_011680 [Botrytis byssoidea]